MIRLEDLQGEGLYISRAGGTYSLPPRPFTSYALEITAPGVIIRAPLATTYGNGRVRGGPMMVFHHVSGSDSIAIQDAAAIVATVLDPGEHFEVFIAEDGVSVIPYNPSVALVFPTVGALIAGGQSPAVATSVELTFATSTWSAGPTMGVARAEGCGCGNGQRMFIAQDRSAGTANQDRVEQLLVASGSWAHVATLNDTRIRGSAASYRATVIFFGGDDEGVDVFDTISASLAAGVALPYIRTRGGAVALPGFDRVMILSGEDIPTAHLLYHGPSQTYETVNTPTSTLPCRSFSTYATGGAVRKVGGYDDTNSMALTDHDAWDPVTRTWSVQTALGAARYEAAGFTRGRDGAGYVAGGLDGTATAQTGVSVWSGAGWSTGPALGAARAYASNQAFGGMLQ